MPKVRRTKSGIHSSILDSLTLKTGKHVMSIANEMSLLPSSSIVIFPNLRKDCSSLWQEPSLLGISSPVWGHVALVSQRGVDSTHPQHPRPWRKPPTVCQVGTLQCYLLTHFSIGIVMGAPWVTFPGPAKILLSGRGFSALGSHNPTIGLRALLDQSFPVGRRALIQPCCDCNVLLCANWHCWESGPSLKAHTDKPVNK